MDSRYGGKQSERIRSMLLQMGSNVENVRGTAGRVASGIEGAAEGISVLDRNLQAVRDRLAERREESLLAEDLADLMQDLKRMREDLDDLKQDAGTLCEDLADIGRGLTMWKEDLGDSV